MKKYAASCKMDVNYRVAQKSKPVQNHQ